jgi:predicted dehydrogenase
VIPRIAVVGTGNFGSRHLRVLAATGRAHIAAVVDTDSAARAKAAAEYHCAAYDAVAPLLAAGQIDAAIVAVPTTAHADVACALLQAGIDVLLEKPIAASLAEARRLIDAAERHGRILQVGHLERFNPAITALSKVVNRPLFFEVHRLSVFSPRSLDVDVVLDLMIHDLDIILSLTRAMPEEVRAAGLSILSENVDIANVRLAFAGGCIANLTASRVSTERVRKLRIFQPFQYISVDYQRQDAMSVRVSPEHQIAFEPLPVTAGEPLRLEVEAFLDSVEHRTAPLVGGRQAAQALELALTIADTMEAHRKVVAATLLGTDPAGQLLP